MNDIKQEFLDHLLNKHLLLEFYIGDGDYYYSTTFLPKSFSTHIINVTRNYDRYTVSYEELFKGENERYVFKLKPEAKFKNKLSSLSD